jgi:hypothetical protein
MQPFGCLLIIGSYSAACQLAREALGAHRVMAARPVIARRAIARRAIARAGRSTLKRYGVGIVIVLFL